MTDRMEREVTHWEAAPGRAQRRAAMVERLKAGYIEHSESLVHSGFCVSAGCFSTHPCQKRTQATSALIDLREELPFAPARLYAMSEPAPGEAPAPR